MEVREAVQGDLEELCAFDHVARSMRTRAEFLRQSIEAGFCLVAAREQQLLGYGILDYSFFENGFLALLYVRQGQRRQGIGARLVQALEARCRTAKLFTSTNQSNLPMQALLKAMGYRESGIIHNLDPEDPELVYFKRLREGC